VAYLDDTHLFLPQHIDTAAMAYVRRVVERLVGVGLEVNLAKSWFLARAGSLSAAEERALMAVVDILFVDASTPEAVRDFVKAGVPVSTDEVLHQWLCSSLLDHVLWRLA